MHDLEFTSISPELRPNVSIDALPIDTGPIISLGLLLLTTLWAEASMVMSQAASLALLQTPHHNGILDCDDGKAMLSDKSTTGCRRPRIREVTSRYKSPAATSVSPAPVPNRRFPTPNADRFGSVPDVPSPKRALSAERRRPSPSRTGESKGSNNGSLDAAMVSKRPPVRTELLWPSTRSLSTSMQVEQQSLLPPNGATKTQIDGKGKANNRGSYADQTLQPSANLAQRSAKSAQRSVDNRKPTPERKGTPLRCQNIDQVENAKPQENMHKLEQCRPGSVNGKISGAAMSRSVDLSLDREQTHSREATASLSVQGKPQYGSSRVPRPGSSSLRSLSQSINEGPTVSSSSQRTRSDSRGRRRDSPIKNNRSPIGSSPHGVKLQHEEWCIDGVVNPIRQAIQAVELACSESSIVADNASDTESVSSGGTTATSSSRGSTPVTGGPGARAIRGTTVPARFWQDSTSRSRRASENSKLRASMPEPDFSGASGGRSTVRHKTTMSSEISLGLSPASNGSSLSPWLVPSNRSLSGFLPPQQPLSPARISPFRNIPSPARSRGTPPPPLSSQTHRSSSAAVMLTFLADTRKGKKGMSQVEEAHLHRILQNRLLQWRFVNARGGVAMNAQTFLAEKSLFNVCSRIFDLRTSVTLKRIRLQQARQAHKLNALLSIQAPNLEEWSSLQDEHSSSLTGAVHALEAAVLQVPVTGGVKADIVGVKGAIGSAFDVMNSVENSVNYILPKAEKTNSLVSELANVVGQERVLMAECADLLTLASAFEAEECSLQTHLLQLEYERARVLGHLMDTAMVPIAAFVGSS